MPEDQALARTVPLRAAGAKQTRRNLWYRVVATAFMFAWLFGIDALLREAGWPGSQRPLWMRLALVSIAVLPIAVYLLASIQPRLGRALGLIAELPARAILDPSGLTLWIDDRPPIRHQWPEIESLEPDGRDWRLTGSGDETIARIPRELVRPRATWLSAPTLAEAIVAIRPDRYALRGRTSDAGMTEFGLRQVGDPYGVATRRGRPGILAAGTVLFAVAFVALVWLLDTRP